MTGEEKQAGIFITKGMTLAVPPGSLKVTLDGGQPKATLQLHVRFDVTPTWLGIARRCLAEAYKHRTTRDLVWGDEDPTKKAEALEAEFEAALQCIVASVTSLEALFAIIRPLTEIPAEVSDRWKEKKPHRYIQVAEVLRYAFSLPQQGVNGLMANLKQIYQLRNKAVHPSGDIAEAMLHPELGVGVERRFALYRASNAEKVFDCCYRILWELAYHRQPTNEKISEYLLTLRERLDALFPEGHKFVIQVTPKA